MLPWKSEKGWTGCPSTDDDDLESETKDVESGMGSSSSADTVTSQGSSPNLKIKDSKVDSKNELLEDKPEGKLLGLAKARLKLCQWQLLDLLSTTTTHHPPQKLSRHFQASYKDETRYSA